MRDVPEWFIRPHEGALYIGDDEADSGRSVTIEDSRLTGDGASGFAILLAGSGDRVSVRRSTVDYPLTVGAAVTGKGEPAATVELVDTVLRSFGEGSEGVNVGAPKLIFERLKVEVPAPDKALVTARRCTGRDLSGAEPRCDSW